MFNLLHAGFDTLDFAIQGALPAEALSTLEKAREESSETQEQVLTAIGPEKTQMHVSSHGMRGGYAYVTDTGPLGAKWMFKKNADPTQWNIFVSPRATMLLAYGLSGTRDQIWQALKAMGATITDHSINRVDFAMDFGTSQFELHLEQFVAHAHTKVRPYWGEKEQVEDTNQPSAVLRGRKLESVTVGKLPGRQIIVYDKRREAISRQKYFWFKAWGVDSNNQSAEIWRIEIRAGKKELKDRWQVRQYDDLDAAIGDVCLHALSEIRYLSGQQTDSNVSRQQLHPLWCAAQKAVTVELAEFRSGLLPEQVLEIERDLAQRRYLKLATSNFIGLGVALGLDDETICEELTNFEISFVTREMKTERERISKSIKRARQRLHFIDARS